MIEEQPQSFESRIRQARQALSTWECELAKSLQNGSGHKRLFSTRVQVCQKRLDALLLEAQIGDQIGAWSGPGRGVPELVVASA